MKYKSTKKFLNDLKPFVGEDDSSVIIEMALNRWAFGEDSIDYCEWNGKKFELHGGSSYNSLSRSGYGLEFPENLKLFLKEMRDINIEEISSNNISFMMEGNHSVEQEYSDIKWATPLTEAKEREFKKEYEIDEEMEWCDIASKIGYELSDLRLYDECDQSFPAGTVNRIRVRVHNRIFVLVTQNIFHLIDDDGNWIN